MNAIARSFAGLAGIGCLCAAGVLLVAPAPNAIPVVDQHGRPVYGGGVVRLEAPVSTPGVVSEKLATSDSVVQNTTKAEPRPPRALSTVITITATTAIRVEHRPPDDNAPMYLMDTTHAMFRAH